MKNADVVVVNLLQNNIFKIFFYSWFLWNSYYHVKYIPMEKMYSGRFGTVFAIHDKNKNSIILFFISRPGWVVKLNKDSKEYYKVIIWDTRDKKISYGISRKEAFDILEKSDGILIENLDQKHKNKVYEFYEICKNCSVLSIDWFL